MVISRFQTLILGYHSDTAVSERYSLFWFSVSVTCEKSNGPHFEFKNLYIRHRTTLIFYHYGDLIFIRLVCRIKQKLNFNYDRLAYHLMSKISRK